MGKTSKKRAELEAEYPALFDYVYRYVCWRVPHRPDAEDLVSTIFINAYEKIDHWDQERGKLQQWITGIARFKVIDYWRGHKIVIGLDDIMQHTLLEPATENQKKQEEILDAQRIFDMIMDDLPPDIRALCTLRYVDGLTYSEIAQVTEKQPANVRKIFSLLHQRLKDEYGKYDHTLIHSPVSKSN